MKKSLIVVLLLSLSLFAINLSAKSLAGIKVGGNISQIKGNDVADEVDPTVAPFVGFFITGEVNPFFAIQPEFNISVKGFQYSNYTLGSLGTDDLQILRYYLEIPLLFKLQMPSETSTFGIYAGPYVAFLSKETLKFGDQEEEIPAEFSNTKDTDFGFIIGANLDFFVNENEVFTIDARYAIGLTKIYSTGEDIYNSAISILVGYGWSF